MKYAIEIVHKMMKLHVASSGKLQILAQPWPILYCFTPIKQLSDGMWLLTAKQWENITLR
jgi:hypothetical protein